jgi:hypothetical protein
LAGWAVRLFVSGLGAATALIYVALVWTSPGPDWSRPQPRGFFGVYVGIPIVILVGAIWLASWIAARIDPDQAAD